LLRARSLSTQQLLVDKAIGALDASSGQNVPIKIFPTGENRATPLQCVIEATFLALE
jgi:hypothetical protein